MSKDKKEISTYSIFKPKSKRGIFVDYPELRKFPAFANLTNDEALFVWYYACESSPYYRISSDRDRCEESINNSFRRSGSRSLLSKKDEDLMLSGRFSGKISSAIKEMERFKIGPRVRALQMIEKNLDNLEAILDINAKEEYQFANKDGEVDWSKKKAFVDTMAKANEILPKLTAQLEGRYGLSEDKKGNSDDDEELDAGLIDKYHENR